MKEEGLSQSFEVLFESLEKMVSSKTVFGEPITVGNVVIVPIIDIAFGAAAGGGMGNTAKEYQGVGGGAGARMSASAVLVVRDSQVQVLKLKNTATVDRLLELVPDFLQSLKKDKASDNGEFTIESKRAEP
ncbi:MAG: hypothetical protein H6Q75_1006 [Firmicutes bacterium]|nr:hypothetical protein [Bacillota bacterium]